MPQFAANLGYLFTERLLLERIDAAAAAGFKAVELQFPYDVPAAAVKAAIRKNNLTILGHQHAARRARGRVRACCGAEPRERLAGPVCARPRVRERDRRQRNSLSCRKGRARAAARCRSRIHRQSCTRGRPCGSQEHHIADRADQRARPAELFSQSCRARGRCDRKDRKAEYPGAVRLLPRADRGRRSDPSPGKVPAGDRSSAMCRSADTA